MLLLALGGAHDVFSHNTSISGAIGISQDAFRGVVIALGVAGASLMLLGAIRRWRRDRDSEARLADMQQELARLEDEAADIQ